MHLPIQALSLASYRHTTETKETNISNKRNIVKNPNWQTDSSETPSLYCLCCVGEKQRHNTHRLQFKLKRAKFTFVCACLRTLAEEFLSNPSTNKQLL